MQLLIDHNHSFDSILTYTLPQINFFLEGIQEVEEEKMKTEIITSMYGSRAGEEEIKKVLSQLDTAKINHRFNDNFDEGEG